ncbi:MAG: hypothetical protein M0P71_00985 [Melioribacteraceae bacterium]|nr:hypothetical protein [Melioribacteraceae bacterium]
MKPKRKLKKIKGVLKLISIEEVNSLFKIFYINDTSKKNRCVESILLHGYSCINIFINIWNNTYGNDFIFGFVSEEYYTTYGIKVFSFSEFLGEQGLIPVIGVTYFVISLSRGKWVIKKLIYNEENKHLFGFENFYLTRKEAVYEKEWMLSIIEYYNE